MYSQGHFTPTPPFDSKFKQTLLRSKVQFSFQAHEAIQLPDPFVPNPNLVSALYLTRRPIGALVIVKSPFPLPLLDTYETCLCHPKMLVGHEPDPPIPTLSTRSSNPVSPGTLKHQMCNFCEMWNYPHATLCHQATWVHNWQLSIKNSSFSKKLTSLMLNTAL